MENIHTIDSLNAKLLTEITKLRKENDKIPELEKKFAEICDSGTGFLCCGWSWLSIDSSVSTVDLSNSIVDQQNNADTKSIEGVAKVSDKEIDDFVPEEPITKGVTCQFTSTLQKITKIIGRKGDGFFLGFGKQENV
ncbi:hypothetical protein C2G38_2191874 [Gigaspora rosea]|uniref:Uncharacterized protein n=1 Tax=Gigaspora rosea TaxID=44941 RepID=A0A397V3Z2_9GLOM|nr:hypothetical protein C2G38_2191874 [Gigaspora rosea]